ncbi:MAG: hypothetical protein CMP57_00025 [Flavobacteriales bacterium]|nr:hypothetical protein [Flavobacteriales bacterium]|tara:strand:+ start:2016 stop:3188 length:1173 start_codon:yes stop_codon:yes gene_type:complete
MAKKILILSHKPPFPKADGGAIAIAQLLEILLPKNEVTFLSIETDKHPSSLQIKDPHLNFQSVYVNTKISLLEVVKNLFRNKSYILSRFTCKAYEFALKTILKKTNFDIVVFESLFTSSYLPIVKKISSATLIYRSHNIEHQIWGEHRKSSTNNPFINAYLKLQAIRLKKEEIAFWNSVDRIACISLNDLKVISTYTKVKINLLGLFIKKIDKKINNSFEHTDFFHLGAMDWKPNQVGIQWICDKVWPTFNKIYPLSTFHIAGRGMPKSLLMKKRENIINHSEVLSAEHFISKHKVMLVPLFSGSGIRVKIIEGLAHGKCIIGTSIALKGITCTHMKNIIIADSVEDFICAMEFCIKNPKKVNQIEVQAKKFALKNFSKEIFLNQVEKIF